MIKIKYLGTTSNDKDHVTKKYVDDGLSEKADKDDLYIVEASTQKKYKLTTSVVGGHVVEHYEEVTT